jgi:hypothetical protein
MSPFISFKYITKIWKQLMDLDKLSSNNINEVDAYVSKKFNTFKGLTYSKSSRTKKCIDYYNASSETFHGQNVIESVYQRVFKQIFPFRDAELLASGKVVGSHKMNADEWMIKQKKYLDNAQNTLNKLNFWKQKNEWQMGENFFSKLVDSVKFVDKTICDTTHFGKEYSSACEAQINSSVTMTEKERSAQFDLMVGFQQPTACSFETHDEQWGTINADLEKSFQAGVWAKGKASVTMQDLGFSAEVQAAIAMGAQLTLAGELSWEKGNFGLALGGDAKVSAGASAQGQMKLSVDARKGIMLAIGAGAFIGFKAEAKGYCSFSYDGKAIVKVEATAGVTFGAGAEFETSIKAPIFGPTEIAFAVSLSAGFGASTSANVLVDFDEAALASSQEFRKVVHWRTLARGYEMTLMNQDARNLYYLNKCIDRMEQELASTKDSIKSYNKLPSDKQPLLMSSS